MNETLEQSEKRAWIEVAKLRKQVEKLTKERDLAWSVNPTVSENLLREQVNNLTQMHKYAVSCEERITKSYLNAVDQHNKTLDELAAITKERDALVDAIDTETVVTHLGVFNTGDDPKLALNKILVYAQDLGKFFAEDSCKEQIAELAKQNAKLRGELLKLACLGHGEQYGNSIGNCIAQEALALPDISTPVLNRIKAEGMRMALSLYSPDDSASDWSDKISEKADELENDK